MFVIGNKSVAVETVEKFTSLLEDIFAKNSSCDSIVIKKTYASSGGANIYKIYKAQLLNDPQTINEIYCIVIKSEYLFQECVKQHPDLNKLNSSSLNSMRIDTFIDHEGGIEIISGFIRMSTNNAFVDNISSGGCFVAIDIKTGKLKKQGYSMINKSGPVVFLQHPVTKTVFENFKIPFFTEAKELVIKTASLMPGLRLVGWDVAISENGPVLIEGNSDYEIRGSDFADGGYLANPVFRKVLREIKYL
jgi:glutathione synthase/RimK-type ligase-like ATP-grasp enzyme